MSGGEVAARESADLAVEIAAELMREAILAEIAQVEAVYPLGDATSKFHCGYAAACEEMRTRCSDITLSTIVNRVALNLEKRDDCPGGPAGAPA